MPLGWITQSGLKVSGGEEWGLLSGWETPISLVSFCSAARSSHIQALDTQTHKERPAPECWGQWLGSPLQATLPISCPRKCPQQGLFQRRLENGPQHPVRPTQPGSELRREFHGGEKDVGVLPSGVGAEACCRGGSGEAEGDLRVSGGPPSSPTLGACGAGTCGRRSGSTSCTGTS